MTNAVAGFALIDWLFLALMLGVCFWTGWRQRGRREGTVMEHQALNADIQWLRAALADSERRCAAQSGWIIDLETELVDARAGISAKTQPPLRAGSVSRPYADLAPMGQRR